LDADSSLSSWVFLFLDGRTISILALRVVKGVAASFPASRSFETLVKLVAVVVGALDEASLPRGVRVLRESTPGIVLAVFDRIVVDGRYNG
jgi:hypothetical protein